MECLCLVESQQLEAFLNKGGTNMNYSLLGWLSVIVFGVVLSPYLLNLLNRKVLKTKNKTFFKVVKFLRSLHKPFGIALIVLGVVHGYMALGRVSLHTGTLFYISILITGILGGSFYRLKKRELFIWHKRMAAVAVVLFLLHFFFPSAMYYLFR